MSCSLQQRIILGGVAVLSILSCGSVVQSVVGEKILPNDDRMRRNGVRRTRTMQTSEQSHEKTIEARKITSNKNEKHTSWRNELNDILQDFSTSPIAVSGAASIGCEDAKLLTVGIPVEGSTISSLTTNAPACWGPSGFVSNGTLGGGDWYMVAGTGKKLIASTCLGDTDFDTQISVFVASDKYDTMDGIGCDHLLTCLDANDDESHCLRDPFQSAVKWKSRRDTVYYIHVNGYMGQVGDYKLIITEKRDQAMRPFPGVAGYETATAVTIGEDNIVGSTLNSPIRYAPKCSGKSGHAHANDGTGGNWYRVVGNGNTVSASTCSFANFDTQISLFAMRKDESSGFSILQCEDGNDDDYDCTEDMKRSTVRWESKPGENYLYSCSWFLLQ